MLLVYSHQDVGLVKSGEMRLSDTQRRGFSNPNNYSFGKSLILVRRTSITDFVYSLFLRS
jgi:hypothetical protein